MVNVLDENSTQHLSDPVICSHIHQDRFSTTAAYYESLVKELVSYQLSRVRMSYPDFSQPRIYLGFSQIIVLCVCGKPECEAKNSRNVNGLWITF